MQIFVGVPEEAIDLISQMLQYDPQRRISAIEALCHPFFDPLRDPSARLPDGKLLPPLFNFSKHGKSLEGITYQDTKLTHMFLYSRIIHSAGFDPATCAFTL